MFEYWLGKFATALEGEIGVLEDSCRKWDHTLRSAGINDNDRVVIKTLRIIIKAVRKALSQSDTDARPTRDLQP